ncbi:MAG TPA: hypothetical protein VKB80_04225, partial [Kofleriaceae bacterium]|nr:hypothetical protein [Kofleriaceae bacterium]
VIRADAWRDFLLQAIGSRPCTLDEAVRLTVERARDQVGLFFHGLRSDGVVSTAIQGAIHDAIGLGELVADDDGRLARSSVSAA